MISFFNLKEANNKIVELTTTIGEKENNVSDEKKEENVEQKEFSLDKIGRAHV